MTPTGSRTFRVATRSRRQATGSLPYGFIALLRDNCLRILWKIVNFHELFNECVILNNNKKLIMGFRSVSASEYVIGDPDYLIS